MPDHRDPAGATVVDLAALGGLVGKEVATSDWLAVTQARIDAFAEATDDRQWIHVDVARTRVESPFGSSVAHGFLTLSLLSALLREAVTITGTRMTLNYGLNRVRFVSPVPSGSRIRARIVLGGLEDLGEGLQATWNITVEREGGDRPAAVAEWIVRYLR
jgi:acyl dehydratase